MSAIKQISFSSKAGDIARLMIAAIFVYLVIGACLGLIFGMPEGFWRAVLHIDDRTFFWLNLVGFPVMLAIISVFNKKKKRGCNE